MPGEFANRSSSGVTYDDLFFNYNNSALSVFSKVTQDCEELGYTATSLCACSNTTYVPPLASENPGKRLIVVVGKSASLNDYHFLIQGNDNTWSHKMGESPAQNTCARHTSVILNNNNISQHMRCHTQPYDYGSTAIFFYVDSHGTTDMSHYCDIYNFPETYQTPVRQYEGNGSSPNKFECAGGELISSEPIRELSRTGYINHMYDVDYFIFDVAETRDYIVRLYTSTVYRMNMCYADVTNVSQNSLPNFTAIYQTLNSGQISFSVHLTAGRRYCLKIYSTNQTVYEADRYYVINIT